MVNSLLAKMQKDIECLTKKASKFNDRYFRDFNLKKDSILRDFLDYETDYDLPDPLRSISYNCKHYIIFDDDIACDDDIEETGAFSEEEDAININYKYKDDDAVLLHEMLHYHISRYEKLKKENIYLVTEVLLLRLYETLKVKIPDLENKIVVHGHFKKQGHYLQEKEHNLLFFLKSLELDLQLSIPLGSVFGYTRVDLLNNTGSGM
jgi:hypothetical protein